MVRGHAVSDSMDMAPTTVCTLPAKVFLAEDSLPVRSRVAALLTAYGMTIAGEAATPKASIDGILATRPDVVVLDAQLEGGTGLQVLNAVRGTDPGIAFIVFSNNVEPACRKRYLEGGAEDFLDKSIEIERLAPVVAKASLHRVR